MSETHRVFLDNPRFRLIRHRHHGEGGTLTYYQLDVHYAVNVLQGDEEVLSIDDKGLKPLTPLGISNGGETVTKQLYFHSKKELKELCTALKNMLPPK